MSDKIKTGVKANHWPFVESPGDFARRLYNMVEAPYLQFNGFLAAVRNALIENPPEVSVEYLTRALRDQNVVDWSVVSEAIHDAFINGEGHAGASDFQKAFKNHGLLVVHEDDDRHAEEIVGADHHP